MKALRKYWWAVLLGLVAVFLAWRVLRPAKQTVTYDTQKVEKGRIVAKVTASGALSALVTVQVGTQVSGRLDKIYVDFNSPVTKGQVLAKLDPQFYQAQLDQSRANRMASAANLEKAKVQALDASRIYERSKTLAEKNLIAQADLETAQTNADAAKAAVSAAEASLAQASASEHVAEVNLGYTTIVSPIDGVVISRSVDVGQTVAASLQAPTLFTIAQDLKQMQVDTSVAEADVGKLHEGMPATFTVDAYPNEHFNGKVRQVRNAPTTVQNVVTYDAVIEVDNPDLRLKPGMTANVTLTFAERDDVMKVPNAALRFRPPASLSKAPAGAGGGGGAGGNGGRWNGRPRVEGTAGGDVSAGSWKKPDGDSKTVWVMRGKTPEAVQVKVGITDGTWTELVSGDLQEGDALVTESSGGDAGGGTSAPGMPGAGGRGRRMM